MKNKLNEYMNFNYMIEEMSSLAYNLNEDFSILHNRTFNTPIEDLKYECENFLYDKKQFPEIELNKNILKETSVLSKYFDKKEIFIEDNKVEYYVYKEDSQIILFKSPINNKTLLRYSKNFIAEKQEIIMQEKTDHRKSEVTQYLINENTCAEIDGLDLILEENDNFKIKPIDNMILQEYAIVFATKQKSDDYTLAYNEIIKENSIACIITSLDPLLDSVVKTEEIVPKEVYKNHYKYTLKNI